MKTELVVGNIRIHFESRVRRRWFVTLFYTALTVFCLAWCSISPKVTTGAWIISGFMIVGTAVMIAFSSINYEIHAPDEREIHRRDHAYFRAYSLLGKFVVAALFVWYFGVHNPIEPFVPSALRGGMVQWPNVFIMATVILYITLPQAIVLWTEPDMDE